MIIALACDHAAYDFKQELTVQLQAQGHEVLDYGCSGHESCDYPDYGIPAARAVAEGRAERAILICNNGIGMSMAANKVPGCLAALVYSAETAQMTRQHHGSNVLCLGAAQFPPAALMEMVRVWLITPFEGGRHERRIGKVKALDAHL